MTTKTWEFTKIPRQLIQLMPSLHWASVKLYFYLQARTNEARGDHKSWPSYKTIRVETGLTNEYISRAIKQLEEYHFLDKLRTRYNIYTLKVPDEEQMVELLKKQIESGKGFLSFSNKLGAPRYGYLKKSSSPRSREAKNVTGVSENESSSLKNREQFSKEQRSNLQRLENTSLRNREKLDEDNYIKQIDEKNHNRETHRISKEQKFSESPEPIGSSSKQGIDKSNINNSRSSSSTPPLSSPVDGTATPSSKFTDGNIRLNKDVEKKELYLRAKKITKACYREKRGYTKDELNFLEEHTLPIDKRLEAYLGSKML